MTDEKERTSEQSSNLIDETDCMGNPLPGIVTPNKPVHTNAFAHVLISGLSLLSFKGSNPKRAEIAFVKDNHSDVRIEIYENGCPTRIWTTENHENFPYPNTKGLEITINSAKTGYGSRYQRNDNPPADPEDFRQMPSFIKFHGRRLPLKSGHQERITARAKIMDATFYTYEMSTSNTIIHKVHKETHVDQPTPGYRIGRILGADIFTNEQKLLIDLRLPNFPNIPPLELPKKANTQYTIVVSTVATDHGHGYGHIKHVYNHILDNSDIHEFDVEFTPEETPWDFCEEIHPQAVEHGNSGHEHERQVDMKSVQFACECWDGSC